MKRTKETQKGITLIALVITIIVLLILAGISIAMLTGDNGLLTKASESKERTERAKVIEEARVDVMAIQAESDGKLTILDFKGVLDKYFKDVPEKITSEDIETLELNTKPEYGEYTVKVTEIYKGVFPDDVVEFTLSNWGIEERYTVKAGTTWREFFTEHPNALGMTYWLAFRDVNSTGKAPDGTVMMVDSEPMGAFASGSFLCDEQHQHLNENAAVGSGDYHRARI